MTNDQLEGVLKAGDILRVRGLWRSNAGGSKKENIQSNSQKVERDKKEQQPITGQIQKIKLVQPTPEKIVETTAPTQPAVPPPQSSPAPVAKVVEKKTSEKADDKPAETNESKRLLDDNKINEQNKNKENVEANGKKRRSNNSDVESTKSRSEVGENVR